MAVNISVEKERADLQSMILPGSVKSMLGGDTANVVLLYLGLEVICEADFQISKECNTIYLCDLLQLPGDDSFLTTIIEDQIKITRFKELATNESKIKRKKLMRNFTRANPTLFVYQHDFSIASSNVTYEEFESVFSIKQENLTLKECKENPHPFLAYFFQDNIKANELVTSWIERNGSHHHLQDVKLLLELELFNDDDQAMAYYRDEDGWTTRLVLALSLHPDIGCNIKQYTSNDAKNFKNLKKKQLALEDSFIIAVASAYMFRGAPDIELKNVVVHHGLHEAEDDEMNDEMIEQEIRRRMLGEVATSTPLGFPVPKCGELLGNMHITFTDRLMKKEESIDNMRPIYGLFINKATGIVCFVMKLNSFTDEPDKNCRCSKFSITIQKTHCEILTAPLLCSALKHCSLIEMHPSGLP